MELGLSGTTVCPLCRRACEEHHRLGMFWRKFGYDGPPYCSRCSSVFRAHMVTRTVSAMNCSRDSACSKCTRILGNFRVSRESAFAAMDEAQALENKREARRMVVPKETLPQTCPHCGELGQASLGQYWRKFGYNGPAYCGNCSSNFRNHMIRQRSTKRECSRALPCTNCAKILSLFSSGHATVFHLMDSKKRARGSGSTAMPTNDTATTNEGGSQRGHASSNRPRLETKGAYPAQPPETWIAMPAPASTTAQALPSRALEALVALVNASTGGGAYDVRPPHLPPPPPQQLQQQGEDRQQAVYHQQQVPGRIRRPVPRHEGTSPPQSIVPPNTREGPTSAGAQQGQALSIPALRDLLNDSPARNNPLPAPSVFPLSVAG
jgi:hypothetical protein